MPIEIEAKFLHINIEDVRARLVAAGAELKSPMRIMRREHFDHSDKRYQRASGTTNERLRIRDEGDKVTVTYKRSSPDSTYDTEVEVQVNSFNAAKQLFEAINLNSFNYQETRREKWLLGEVEVVIDEWPWLDPYVEIEGETEEAIRSVAHKLGFVWEDAVYGSVDSAYQAQYPGWKVSDSIGNVPIVKFDELVPQYLKDRQ